MFFISSVGWGNFLVVLSLIERKGFVHNFPVDVRPTGTAGSVLAKEKEASTVAEADEILEFGNFLEWGFPSLR